MADELVFAGFFSHAAAMPARRRKSQPTADGGRVLHLDAFSGIAGNMFLSALLDAGLSRRELEADLAGLGVEHSLRVSRVKRGALAARYLDVRVPARRPSKAKGRARKKAGHSHGHSHKHSDDGHAHSHSHGRTYLQIVRLLERARLEAGVRDRALAIFEALGRAEARVHGIALEKVHFHEVGAVDAIVDVTGAAIALSRLGIRHVTSSPVALGHGTVETDHGRLPLPAPATLELLRGIPTVPAHVAWETVTPTGAAILRTVVSEFCALPAMTVEAIGHGAGNDREGPMPNLLRAVVGRSAGFEADRVLTLETHLDDLVPEHFDHVMERLFDAGALDVSIQHLQMKKNRPGFALRAIVHPSERIAVARMLFAESTAIGVRVTESDRITLRRESRSVKTRYGRVRVKCVWDDRGEISISAEYDDCKRAATRTGAALRDVIRAAEQAGYDAAG